MSFLLGLRNDLKHYDYHKVKTWLRNKKVEDYELMLYPINIQNTHWTLAVTFVKDRKIIYYDSMGKTGKKYLTALTKYYYDSGDKKKWTLVDQLKNTPQQDNLCDCGVFLCINAFCVVNRKIPSYTTEYLKINGRSAIKTSIEENKISKLKI